MAIIDSKILQGLYKGLEPIQYSRVACAIRFKVIQCLQDLLPMTEPTDFYERCPILIQSISFLSRWCLSRGRQQAKSSLRRNQYVRKKTENMCSDNRTVAIELFPRNLSNPIRQ